MDIEQIRLTAERALEGSDMYVVECVVTPANDITVVIDSDTAVTVDACAAIDRAISARFDRDEEDFSLTVASAGIGEELKLLRQYRRLVGRSVEVLLNNGIKITAVLDAADEQGITLSYDEKVAVEGRKRKELRHTVASYPFSEIKSAREWLDYK